jgi:hypothetical protein
MRPLLLALAFLLAAPASAQVAVLEPVDEAAEDPSFLLFRARLLEAAQARDTSFVLSVLHPDVKVSFGAGDGVAGFRRMWLRGMNPEGENLWTALTRTLALGSTYLRTEDGTRTATAPYVFGAWPDTLDAFEHLAVVGERVRVRSAPRSNAETLTTLTYHVVPTLYDPSLPDGWRRITLADGRTGYVAAAFLRSPIDYRLGFVREGTEWRVRYFVAGD